MTCDGRHIRTSILSLLLTRGCLRRARLGRRDPQRSRRGHSLMSQNFFGTAIQVEATPDQFLGLQSVNRLAGQTISSSRPPAPCAYPLVKRPEPIPYLFTFNAEQYTLRRDPDLPVP